VPLIDDLERGKHGRRPVGAVSDTHVTLADPEAAAVAVQAAKDVIVREATSTRLPG